MMSLVIIFDFEKKKKNLVWSGFDLDLDSILRLVISRRFSFELAPLEEGSNFKPLMVPDGLFSSLKSRIWLNLLIGFDGLYARNLITFIPPGFPTPAAGWWEPIERKRGRRCFDHPKGSRSWSWGWRVDRFGSEGRVVSAKRLSIRFGDSWLPWKGSSEGRSGMHVCTYHPHRAIDWVGKRVKYIHKCW